MQLHIQKCSPNHVIRKFPNKKPLLTCFDAQFTWGPMCFIVAVFITTSHPLRHPLQIIICVGQIYGLILYYGTSMFDHYYNEIAYSRPEAWYFWGYYFFMNFIWMVFPGSKFAPKSRSFGCHELEYLYNVLKRG